MSDGWADDLALAKELAALGGAEALDRFGRISAPTRKRDGSWVTEADLASEAAIRTSHWHGSVNPMSFKTERRNPSVWRRGR